MVQKNRRGVRVSGSQPAASAGAALTVALPAPVQAGTVRRRAAAQQRAGKLRVRALSHQPISGLLPSPFSRPWHGGSTSVASSSAAVHRIVLNKLDAPSD